MQPYLNISILVLAAILTGLILLQQRGTGLGGVFGGSGGSFQTRRGMERTLFIVTVVVAILFFGASAASLLLK